MSLLTDVFTFWNGNSNLNPVPLYLMVVPDPLIVPYCVFHSTPRDNSYDGSFGYVAETAIRFELYMADSDAILAFSDTMTNQLNLNTIVPGCILFKQTFEPVTAVNDVPGVIYTIVSEYQYQKNVDIVR